MIPLAVALFGLAASLPTSAEPEPDAAGQRFDPFWNVEITGSSMLSHDSRQALPSIQYSRQDIAHSGALKLSDFIQSLPQQVNGMNEAALAAGLASSGPLSTALRGLAASTLVLLNGRRLPRYSRATVGTERTGIDLDVIPLAAVERIDVLTDGASTRYGSDAVAGVINIITRDAVAGMQVGLALSQPQARGGAQRRADLSLGGAQLARDGWDWQAHLSLTGQSALLAQHRDASAGLPRSTGVAGEYFAMPSLTQRAAWPATVVGADGLQISPLPDANGACPADWFAITVKDQALCRYNLATGVNVYPQQAGAQLYALGRVRLGASLSAFAELAASQRRTLALAVSPAAKPWAWTQDLGGGQTASAAPLPLGVGNYRFDHRSFRLTLGLQGQQSAWRHASTLVMGESHDSTDQDNLFNRLSTAPAWADLGLSGSALVSGATDASTLDALRQGLPQGTFAVDRGRSRIDALQTLASRTLAHFDAGEVSLALGASWTRESVHTQTFALGTGVSGVPDAPAISGQRHNVAAHAELELPLRGDTTLGVQLRHDRYSDVGGVSTGKLALRHQSRRELMWRASLGSGFRAPTLEQVHGSHETLYAVSGDGTQDFYSVANPDLRPERSQHFSAGLRLEPTPQWSLGLDYWRLNIRDGIQLLSRSEIDASADYSALYKRPLANGRWRYTLTPLNLVRRTQAGIDYDLQWRRPSDWGRLRLKWHGTVFIKALRDNRNAAAVSEIGVLFDGFQYIPRHQALASVALQRAQDQFWLGLHYRSGNSEAYRVYHSDTDSVSAAGLRRVAGHLTWDLGWVRQMSPHSSWSASLVNLTNRAPPFRYNTRGIFIPAIQPSYGDYRGRTLQVSLKTHF